jgi:hypothetical protein
MLADTLFISWVRVVVVWWLSVFVWWGVSNQGVVESFMAIPDVMFHFSGERCELAGVGCSEEGVPGISAANAIHYLGYVVGFWTFPVLLAVLLSSLLGSGLAYATRYRINQEEIKRLKAEESWRGMQISLGALPKPVWIPEFDKVKISFDKDIKSKLEVLEPRHHQLLSEIFGFLKSHPDAFVGDGHKGTLLEHTLGVFQESIESASDPMDPLLPLAAAAHDMGKVVTHYKGEDGEWVRRRGNAGFHDYQGGLLLSSLPGYADLNDEERSILVILIKYAHKPNRAPIPSEDQRERIVQLFEDFRKADKSVTAEEKQEVIEDLKKEESLDDIITNAFMEAITTFKFQDPNLPKSQKAIGWRKGNELILIEIQFREKFATMLPKDLLAAWGGIERQKNSLAGLTKNFLDWLDEKGWLVREVDVFKKPTDEEPFKRELCPPDHYPLWSLWSGDKPFVGVYAVRIPEEFHKKLPHETQFDLKYFGYMKPPKGTAPKKAQSHSTSPAGKKLQGKHKSAKAKAADREKEFEKALSKHPSDVQEKVRKKLARYKAMGMHALPGEEVLKAVLAEAKGATADSESKRDTSKNADRRAQLDQKKGTKPETSVFDSLNDEDKRSARELLSKSLNTGIPMRLEDAAIRVKEGATSIKEKPQAVDNKTEKRQPTQSKGKEETKSRKPSNGFKFTAENVVDGAFGTLDPDQKKCANKLLGEALNSGVRMNRDEAASIVLEGKYPPSEPSSDSTGLEGSQKPAVENVKPTESSKKISAEQQETKAVASKQITDADKKYWTGLDMAQKKQAMKRIEECLNSGQKPDKEAIARDIITGSYDQKDPVDATRENVKEASEAPTGEQQNEKASKPKKRRRNRKPDQAAHVESRSKDNSTPPSPSKQGEVKRVGSLSVDDLTDDEKKKFRRLMTESLNASRPFDKATLIKSIIAERDLSEAASVSKGNEDKSKTDEKPVNAEPSAPEVKPEPPVVLRSMPQEPSEISPVADQPFPAITSDISKREGSSQLATQNAKKEAKTVKPEPRQEQPLPPRHVPEINDAVEEEEPNLEFPAVTGHSYGAVVGLSGGASPLSQLTDKEVARLKKEVREAIEAGKRGVEVNRVAIAKKIIAERSSSDDQEQTEKPEITQFRILADPSE